MVCHANLASPAESADGDARDYFLVMMVSQTRHNACIDCHTEHRGEDGELTKMDLTDFDHLLSGFSLQSHQRTAAGEFFTCRECHGLNFTAFDQVVCTACHTQQDAGFVQEHTAEYGGGLPGLPRRQGKLRERL